MSSDAFSTRPPAHGFRFGLMPADANHFAYTRQETMILLHGMGPVDFKYVNPADDHRNPKPGSR